MASIGSNLISPNSKTGSRSMYSDRVFLSQITDDPTLGQDKVRTDEFANKKIINELCNIIISRFF